MKPDNWNRFAAGLLAILLCLCSFSMPAFASGSDPVSYTHLFCLFKTGSISKSVFGAH